MSYVIVLTFINELYIYFFQIVQSFRYNPVHNAWRANNFPRLGIHLQQPLADSNIQQAVPLTPPSAVHRISGDGNCLFRALSYALTYSEDHHMLIRQSVCDYMRRHPANIRYILPDNVKWKCRELLNLFKYDSEWNFGGQKLKY